MIRKMVKESYYYSRDGRGNTRITRKGHSQELSDRIEDTVDYFMEYMEGTRFKSEQTAYNAMVRAYKSLVGWMDEFAQQHNQLSLKEIREYEEEIKGELTHRIY